MRVIAERPLHGEYGTVPTGAVLELPERYAKNLLRRGLARELPPEPIPVQPSEHPALAALRAAVEEAEKNLRRKRRNGTAAKRTRKRR